MLTFSEIKSCALYIEDIFGIYNVIITIAFSLFFFIYKKLVKKNYSKYKNKKFGFIKAETILKFLKSRKAFILFWALFIVLNLFPILCIIKNKVAILEKQKAELQDDIRKFQNLLLEASDIMHMSEDYYEKMRKQLIHYPPNIKLSTTYYKVQRTKLMKEHISEDLKHNKRCYSFIKKIKHNKTLAPTYVIERLKEANNNICKDSYYALYLIGLNAMKIDNLSEAKNYLNKSIKVAERKGIFDCTLYHTYAQALLFLEEYDEAKNFLQKALSFCTFHPYADAHLRILKELKRITNYKKRIQKFKEKLNSLSEENQKQISK